MRLSGYGRHPLLPHAPLQSPGDHGELGDIRLPWNLFFGAIFWRGNLGVHSAVGEGAGVEDKEVLGGV